MQKNHRAGRGNLQGPSCFAAVKAVGVRLYIARLEAKIDNMRANLLAIANAEQTGADFHQGWRILRAVGTADEYMIFDPGWSDQLLKETLLQYRDILQFALTGHPDRSHIALSPKSLKRAIVLSYEELAQPNQAG